jgi:phosphate acetyltransferase
MMSILTRLQDKAKGLKRHVVLPEGEEPRVIQATKKILNEDIAKVTLLGNEDTIAKLAKESGLNLGKVEVVNPSTSPNFHDYTQQFMELRKAKGISEQEAETTMEKTLYYGAMMVRNGKADGSVAGSINTTGDVLRAGIQIIGLAEGIRSVSSCFMMVVPEFMGEYNKVFLFADGAVIPNPSAPQLGSVAVSTARTMKVLVGEEPRIAMLSFSTKGSAEHADVNKVREGLRIAKEIDPNLVIDGELQVDAAIPAIAESKAPGSPVEGRANVLIFPDLDAGNIAYKIVQRLAKAQAIGPIIQGLAKPANDLSRGCTSDDIVNVTAIAMIMSTL